MEGKAEQLYMIAEWRKYSWPLCPLDSLQQLLQEGAAVLTAIPHP